jgi:hypothetical protein
VQYKNRSHKYILVDVFTPSKRTRGPRLSRKAEIFGILSPVEILHTAFTKFDYHTIIQI